MSKLVKRGDLVAWTVVEVPLLGGAVRVLPLWPDERTDLAKRIMHLATQIDGEMDVDAERLAIEQVRELRKEMQVSLPSQVFGDDDEPLLAGSEDPLIRMLLADAAAMNQLLRALLGGGATADHAARKKKSPRKGSKQKSN